LEQLTVDAIIHAAAIGKADLGNSEGQVARRALALRRPSFRRRGIRNRDVTIVRGRPARARSERAPLDAVSTENDGSRAEAGRVRLTSSQRRQRCAK
jgi:hypothetical protein